MVVGVDIYDVDTIDTIQKLHITLFIPYYIISILYIYILMRSDFSDLSFVSPARLRSLSMRTSKPP